MLKSEKLGKIDGYVYDIHLDGTVVNALGNNVLSNTDGFNFQLPQTYRYTKDNPYIGKGLNRNVTEGKEYTGFEYSYIIETVSLPELIIVEKTNE